MGNISTLRVLQHQYLLFEFYLSFAFCRVITAEVVFESVIHPLSANPTKWWNILKQFVGKSRWIVTNCLNVFDHFVGLALKGLWKIFNLESSTKTMRLTNTLKHHLPQDDTWFQGSTKNLNLQYLLPGLLELMAWGRKIISSSSERKLGLWQLFTDSYGIINVNAPAGQMLKY